MEYKFDPDKANQDGFNMYLEELAPKKYRLIMPNDDGGLRGVQVPHDGMAIKWPVNPHFTGKSAIIIMLNEIEKFKDCEIR
jgi:hypothetical protein